MSVFDHVKAARIACVMTRHIPCLVDDPDPFHRAQPEADGRWQRGSTVGGFYLADNEDTAWGEWYRHVASLHLPPAAGLPRYLLSYEVDATVADLRTPDALAAVGLPEPDPEDDWDPFQAVGDELFRRGWRGLAAPSAARRGSFVACLFRPVGVDTPPGVTFIPPPVRHDEAPAVPRRLRT